MKGAVYLYFGANMLTNGSYEDLQKLGISPVEGLRLKFYDLDADDEDQPTYLCAEGTLYSVTEIETAWYARIDESSFHSVLRSEADAPPLTSHDINRTS
jgi:hypothetical protein